MSELTQLFSRARPLFYFIMWYETDALGTRRFLGEELRGTLFIARPAGENAEVWYSKPELDRLAKLSLARLGESAQLRKDVIASWEDGWGDLKGYFDGTERLTDADSVDRYIERLTRFWSGMNTVFFSLADDPAMHPEVAEAMMRIRERTQHHTDRMSTLFVEYFAGAFPEEAHLSFYATAEDVHALEDGDPGVVARLSERARTGCYLLDGELAPLPELDAELARKGYVFEKVAVVSPTNGTLEVRGKTAQKGKATGRARVALSPAEARATEEGEVLIAPMTTPDYIDAMHRAAAFVTDEGGIVCHAAVTAREMGKPCIIGTKTASRSFTTGDLVEVDADAGIARKV